MRTHRYDLWHQGEYEYALAFGFQPNVVSYLHEDETIRPALVVVPGGGYAIVSPTEAGIVAEAFYARGYNAFVLTYTTNLLQTEPLRMQPMKDLSRAVRLIRKKAAEFCIDPNRLAVCGFSAGGHLSASVCVHYQDVKDNDPAYADISNRPDAAILSYPVITAGDYKHSQSFRCLVGLDASQPEVDYMSVERHVTKDTPPCFVWQTAEDESVSVENSYLYAEACRRKEVCFAHHVFSNGGHGLSLADEIWAAGKYGEPYTMEQTIKVLAKVKNGEIMMPEEEKAVLLDQYEGSGRKRLRRVNNEVRVWPRLAGQWLEKLSI